MTPKALVIVVLVTVLQVSNASWFSSFFGRDMGDGVSKPGTSDPDTLQEQIDILLHDQKKHKADSEAYRQAQLAIDIRKRRIETGRYLDAGMSAEDYETLNDIQDELVPLKKRLRTAAAASERRDSPKHGPDHERMLLLSEQAEKLIGPYSSSRGKGKRPIKKDAVLKGLNKDQLERARDLRQKIKESADMPDKVQRYREQLSRLYENAQRKSRWKKAGSSGTVFKKKNHTLAKRRHLELSALRQEIDETERRGHSNLSAALKEKLSAAQDFYTRVAEAERVDRAQHNREIAHITALLEQAMHDDNDELVRKYRAKLASFDVEEEAPKSN